jgi:hypothetical protein
MKIVSRLMRCSVGVCATAALIAGCGGSQPQVASDGYKQAATAVPPLNHLSPFSKDGILPATLPDHGPSWMEPDAVNRARLLYVTDPSDGDAYALSLPSGKLVGKLTGFDQPLGDCVDEKGDVFIASSQNAQVREYKHGARQAFNVLNDSGYYPLGCSIDPTSGNLAVTNIIGNGNGSDPGNVAIYKNARGTPKYYADPSIYQYGYCSYDGLGNLYIDGITPPSDNPQVAELPKGSKKFTNITLNQSLGGNNISALLWDGTDLAVASQDSGVIYQFQISGSNGTEVGSTQLTGSSGAGAFWIESGTLYAPVYVDSVGSVNVYPYPGGGKPSKKYYAAVAPWAATLSVKVK